MNKCTFLGVLSALTILAFVSMASADVATFRDLTATGNDTGARDAFLRGDTASQNVNVGITAATAMGGAGDRWYPTQSTRPRYSLYWWDISSIQAGLQPGESIQVNSATFSLWMQEGSDMTAGVVRQGNVSRVQNAWIEGTNNGGGVNAGEPTWNHRVYNTSAWATPGATGASDIADTLTFSTTPPASGRTTFRQDIDVTNIAKQWLENGAPNNGMLLHGGDWNAGSLSFACYLIASNEYTGSDWQNRRPLLTIDYSIVPEPTALVLLGIGGLLSLRRRK